GMHAVASVAKSTGESDRRSMDPPWGFLGAVPFEWGRRAWPSATGVVEPEETLVRRQLMAARAGRDFSRAGDAAVGRHRAVDPARVRARRLRVEAQQDEEAAPRAGVEELAVVLVGPDGVLVVAGVGPGRVAPGRDDGGDDLGHPRLLDDDLPGAGASRDVGVA